MSSIDSLRTRLRVRRLPWKALRTIAAAAVALAALIGLASCAEAGVSQADAYRIGCPAVDAAVGGVRWSARPR
jgi:hypothetical protein